MQTDQSTRATQPRAIEFWQHSKEFKADAVRLVKEGGHSSRDVAQSLGLVSTSSLAAALTSVLP